ncbi:aquaporin [Catellatospora aurea]|uniref:Aquaporin n=1 Tax=Catellatospora aurea TaxID=1337874 RepID=A0ABW2H408_9ACTN
MLALTLLIGLFIARPRLMRLMPYAIGAAVALVIAVFKPLSGGSVNPARQLGPALLSGRTTDLAIYLLAPILGAALGAAVHHLLVRRIQPYGQPA